MNEAKNFHYGKTIAKKVVSWLLVLAMVLGLAPADFTLMVKAAEGMNVTLHFQPAEDWERPALQVWDGTPMVTGSGEAEEITGWGGAKGTPMTAEEGGWYAVTVKGNIGGCQFLDLSTPSKNINGIYKSTMKNYTGTEATDLYYIDGAWYLDKEKSEAMPVPTPVKVNIHFLNSKGWELPTVNAWNGVTVTGSAGKAETTTWANNMDLFTVEDEKEVNGWYSVTLACDDAITGIQIIDAVAPDASKVQFSSEELKKINACTDLENVADIYYGYGILSTNKEDIKEKVVISPDVPVMVTRESPVYGEDGIVTFNLASKEEKAILKGVFTSWEKNQKEMIPVTDAEDGFKGFTVTAEVPRDGGLYEYGMVEGEDTWVGDPENKTTKGNPVVVRNPEIGNGSVTIYRPFVGDSLEGKVLYRKAGTTDTYKEAAFTPVEGAENLFAAVITDAEADVKYEYKVQIGTEEATYDKYNFASQEVIDGAIATTFTATQAIVEPEYTSPVINSDKTVTFNYWAPSATAVYVAGDMNGWNEKATALTKNEETGLFSVTMKIPAGSYGYKFVVDGDWVLDPKNSETNTQGNSLLVVPVSEDGVKSPIVDVDNATIEFNFDPADYGIKPEELTGVNLMGTVPGTNWDGGLAMTLTEEGYYTITVKDIQPGRYQYKFKTSGGAWLTDAKNAETESGNSLVIMPGMMITGSNAAGAGTFQYKADGEADEGTAKFSMEEEVAGFSITEDGLLTVSSDAKTGYFTLGLDYKVNNEAKHVTAKFYYTERAAIYEYKYKEDSQYVGQTDIYTWNNAESVTDYKFVEKDGKYTAYINVDPTTTAFGYIIRLFGKWGADESTDREFSDRTFTLNEGERYTKVRGGEGIEVPYVLPSGKTYYDNGIVFVYRDDDKFYNGTMDTIKSAKVVINGEEHDMEYVAEDELFKFPYQNIEDGDYEYYFLIDGKRVEDQYNTSGKLHYEKPELSVKCSITPEESNYDQNPVVTLYVKNKKTGEKVELSTIEADLTSIAGKDMKAQFSTITNKGVLYIDRSVAPGTYVIPILIKDIWGNQKRVAVPVKVTNKTTTDAAWDEARVYFIVTDRFADGDKSNNGTVGYDPTKAEAYHGGDLAGITSKLSYLQELGINTIWITPIVDNIEDIMSEELTQTAYHGYWAKDFTKLDEHLGTTKDLDKLLDEAHKHGIKVMVDIVVNHAGYNTNDSENFKGMLRTEEELGSDFIKYELSGLPDFKTEIQDVRAKLIAWQTAWANHTTAAGNRIDYFRVDTVKHVEHETWQQLKASLAEVNPNFKMIGEFYGASVSNTGDYLGNGQMDSELDFDFKSIARNFANGNIESAEEALETRNKALTNNLTMGQFLSSHDEDGFLYSVNYDLSKAKTAAALQITAKGQPVIYYGEEVALSGPNAFGKEDNNRYDMQFDNLSDDQKAMLAHYKKLLAARAMYSETFATGSRTKIAGSDKDGYLVFQRGTGKDSVYVAINTTDEAKKVTINLNGVATPDTPSAKSMTDIYSGTEIPVVDGSIEITIPASSNGGTAIIAEGKELTGIEVVAPEKTEYQVGEGLDLRNLAVFGKYGDSKVALSSDVYTIDTSAYNLNKAGTYKITVTAYGFSASFNVTVKAVPTAVPTKKPEPTKGAVVNTYTIKYVLNKGTNNKSNPATYTTKDVKLKNPVRKGYDFKGWYTDSKFKKKITTIKASTRANVTVYAKWVKVAKPGKVTVKSVTNVKGKKIKVTLKKKVSGAKGYEIKYTTDKKFKKSVKTVTSTKTTATISKLKKNKTYYVKVRAYKIDSAGKKVYSSSYSKVAKVKIKK